MPGKRKVSQHFLQLSREHAIIWRHVNALDDALKSSATVATLSDLLDDLSGDLAEHFALEEEVLFPAALMGLRDLDIIDHVVTLAKEHGYFERDFIELKNALLALDGQAPPPLKEHGQLETLLQCFRHHARIETDTLFAQMDRTPACTKILKGFLID